MRFPQQAQFHPLKYLQGLAESLVAGGVRLFTQARVVRVVGGPNAFVQTANGTRISCGAVVVATNSPINNRIGFHTLQAAYRTYAVGFAVPRGVVPKALCWDTADPYHYVRLVSHPSAPEKEILLVGGEDHRTGERTKNNDCFVALTTWTRERFPVVQEPVYQWSGQVLEPVDALARIGHNPHDADNVYVATGDSGHGMTHGTLAGPLLTALIQGQAHPWQKLYDPGRFSFKSLGEYTKENATTGLHYLEWLRPGEVSDASRIAPGMGAVVQQGLHKVATYRDEQGDLHECSAVCTHLGGVVHWNPIEKSWDCPCHGSRFAPDGQVLCGPAFSPLSQLSKEG